MRYLDKIFNLRNTLPTRNSAGGYVWPVDSWKQLERFLILGCENGTYYVTETAFTVENAQAVQECLKADGPRVVNAVVDISASGRAAKSDPALFVLAMAASPAFADARTNAEALSALALVARTGSHLCTFACMVDGLRGWGRGLRSAVADWYLNKPVNELAHQMLKYPTWAGWSHRDLLRASHPKAGSPEQNALFRWAVDSEIGNLAPDELRQVHGLEQAKRAMSETEIVRLIEDYRLTHEMIPSQWKESAGVWEALLPDLSYKALVRHLGKMTALGVIAPFSEASAIAVARLIDRRRIERARIHPIALLGALLAYRKGCEERGNLRWAPVSPIVDALEESFYLAFANVSATGQRIYLAIDASSSMQNSICQGLPFVSAAMGAAAMAMLFARTESNYMISAFHDRIWPVDISRKDRLDRACAAIAHEPRAADGSLPFKDALERGLEVDAFVLLTDSKTWAGDTHPVQAFERYRQESGIGSKLVVIAMTGNGCSMADANDALQMEVVGFDAGVPGVVAGFIVMQAS
jgi:60 kDa SS-A/Ro ribonucleoprotein